MLKNRPRSPDQPQPAGTDCGGFVIRRVDPLADPRWDAMRGTVPSDGFFHGSAWARVLHDTYGFAPAYFTLGEADQTCGLLPIMEVDSWLTGRRGIALPFTDECDPLVPDAESFRRVFAAALEHAKHRAWKYLECRGGMPWFGGAPPSTSFYGHRLDLAGDESARWNRVAGAMRRAVRKAEQNGLTIEFSRDLGAVKDFHRLLCGTRRRLGVPPQPFRFFQNIHRHILAQNGGWVALVRHGQVAIAGAIFFHFGRTAIYKYGASDGRFQHFRGNNLVMWEAIRRFAHEGFAELDFGRTSLTNEGLRRFKLGWGTKERLIHYFRCNVATGDFVPVRDQSSGWHSRVFRMLPIPLSRLIGLALYRHVA